ncbi:hypothetical protein BS50DRAFT_390895 [Corynespora cassiicola Philippines]|uniref:GPI-anchored cell wall organization protein Ecm33 n=1 Tax=Corynespora cassiicola Philippines TaxID=1448308 RepID=A0A2T2NPU8_CORCC|nr:hypothetical protein BS50DRAFT_390895 [Corynespora cassiicola Philippines]
MRRCIASATFLAVQWLAVGAEGAVDCAPTSGSLTLKTPQDVSDLAQCGGFTGNIVVAADGPSAIQLDGLTSVSGNIDIENVAGLTTLSSSTLQALTSMTLNNLPQLSNLSFPSLSNFSSLKWYNLPQLDLSIIAAGPIDGEIQEITVFNTSVKNLDWLVWPVGSLVNITSNEDLREFTIPYNTLNAGCAVSIVSNPSLKSITFDSLNGIYGGLDISDNSETSALDFPNLETIGGFVQLGGSFSNVTMPRLKTINGALSVKSTNDLTDLCEDLSDKNLAGHYDCQSNLDHDKAVANSTMDVSSSPESTGTFDGDDDDDDGKNYDGIKLSQPMKVGIAISIIVLTFMLLVAGFFYIRRRLRSKVRESGGATIPKELEVCRPRMELDGKTMYELDGGHTGSELSVAKEPNTPASPAYSTGSVRSVTPLVRYELPA